MEPLPPFGNQGNEATEQIAQRFMPKFHGRYRSQKENLMVKINT